MTTSRRSLDGRAALVLVGALIGVLALVGCGGSTGAAGSSAVPAAAHSQSAAAKVTFVELGSDQCIPCKEMRPVMDRVQKAFGDQVEIVFYDVWEDPAPANEYGVQMIPTQVFLDDKGAEFHRHTGFYPQKDIEALLVEQGLTKLTTP
jgi:thioredoxin 1